MVAFFVSALCSAAAHHMNEFIANRFLVNQLIAGLLGKGLEVTG